MEDNSKMNNGAVPNPEAAAVGRSMLSRPKNIEVENNNNNNDDNSTANTSKQSQAKRVRSATDYENETSLREALTEPPYRDPTTLPPNEKSVGSCIFNGNLLDSFNCCDYQTAKLDLSTSHAPTLEDEVKRLMELKHFAVLDSDHEEKFERITALASRIFVVPICLISLVDIGRQWFLSNRGLGDVRETTREVSFCAHAILSKEDVFIVPDTHDDPRFKENGLVTGPPYIRFYAGVPLVTPKGYKIGTFCIIHSEPRPNGLSLKEKQSLRELAEMVMENLVNRKQERERIMDEKTRVIACAAHDILSPITGLKLNMEMLMEDKTLRAKLDDNQVELMEASVKCSDMIERICVRAIESFRGTLKRDHMALAQGKVNVDRLLDDVKRVAGTLPKKVPFFIEKNDNVPEAIVSDELKLFRSILNYISNASKHTDTGSIVLKIYVRKVADVATDLEKESLPGALVAPKRDVVIVEVHDSGVGIDIENYTSLFMPGRAEGDSSNEHSQMANSGLGLYSVATEISSLGGEYGVFPRQDLIVSHPVDDDVAHFNGDNEANVTGCVFWMSVPLVLPGHTPVSSPSSKKGKEVKPEDTKLPAKRKIDVTESELSKRSDDIIENDHKMSNGNNESAKMKPPRDYSKRSKRVLLIDDSVTIRKGLSRGFSRLGFEVEQAENGLQGLRKLKAGLYDLVVLDFLMPVLDGPDVARQFRAWEAEHRPDIRQYIVGLSAHANGKDAELGLKAGMDRFMSKPIPLKSLSDLALCKPVMELSSLLDTKHKQSFDVLEAAFAAREDNSIGSNSSNTSFAKHSCLIIAKETNPALHYLKHIVEKIGWRAIIEKHGDGEDALRVLKLRNWDAVFIDNEIGANCCAIFREWERRTRSVYQKNVFILSDTFTDTTLPTGFDGVLTKPIDIHQVQQVLETASFQTAATISYKRPSACSSLGSL